MGDCRLIKHIGVITFKFNGHIWGDCQLSNRKVENHGSLLLLHKINSEVPELLQELNSLLGGDAAHLSDSFDVNLNLLQAGIDLNEKMW